MTKKQEEELTESIRTSMIKVRNDAIALGMKAVMAIVLDICNKDKSAEEKLGEIKEFCEKGYGLNNEKKN